MNPVENCFLKDLIARIPLIVLYMAGHVSFPVATERAATMCARGLGPGGPDGLMAHPVSYPNKRPPEATKMPIMMAGAEEPATLSGLRQPMANAMVEG